MAAVQAARGELPCADPVVLGHEFGGDIEAYKQAGARLVELHPMLAGRIGAADGEPVRVTTRRGTMTAPARVVVTIRPDTVFVPFHWVGANRLTNDALDPDSRMPEFKVCAARVESA